MAKRETVKFTTPVGRVSFAYIFKPNVYKGKETYQIDLVFDEDTDLQEFKKKIFDLKVKTFGKNKDKWPRMHPILKNGDKRKDASEVYAGKFYCTLKSKFPVEVIDKKGKLLLSDKEFYSGCYARAAITIYPYDSEGSRGVTTGLEAIRKEDDGPRLGGQRSAHEAFGMEREEFSEDDVDTDSDGEEDGDSSDW